MSWTGVTADDTLSGKGAKILGQQTFDRIQAAANRYTTWYFAETNITSSLTTYDTQRVRVPPWAVSGETITLYVRAKTDGTGAITLQLNETDTTTNGTPVNHTLSATWAYFAVTLAVPDATWVSTLKTFEVQANHPGGGEADADWDLSGEFVVGNFKFGAA